MVVVVVVVAVVVTTMMVKHFPNSGDNYDNGKVQSSEHY